MQMYGINNALVTMGTAFGEEFYRHQLTEECAELIQALNKVWRDRHEQQNKHMENIIDNVYEEMADVEICLTILKNLMHCQDEVYDCINNLGYSEYNLTSDFLNRILSRRAFMKNRPS